MHSKNWPSAFAGGFVVERTLAMSELTTRDEARDAISTALLGWAGDVSKPMIPAYCDEDGNGAPDFYVLDAFGRVTTIDANDPGFGDYTNVSESTGGGVETGGA